LGIVELHQRHIGVTAGVTATLWQGVDGPVRVELADDHGEVRQIDACDIRGLLQLLGQAALLLGAEPAAGGRHRRA
jgi:hypothetical protein